MLRTLHKLVKSTTCVASVDVQYKEIIMLGIIIIILGFSILLFCNIVGNSNITLYDCSS